MQNKTINILEVNNIDLPGKRFNGYDIKNYINSHSDFHASQIVIDKLSSDDNVHLLYNKPAFRMIEGNLTHFENKYLSTHSNLSLSAQFLQANPEFQKADLVHYHMIHNMHLPLYSLINLCSKKASVITIHDPWFITGHCVHFDECEKWKTGCHNCTNLKTLFPLKKDTSHSLWELKKMVYSNIDADIIVSSPYMLNLIKTSPLTKHFKNVHLLPFGLDINFFNNNFSKEVACQKLGIDSKKTILFFRSQGPIKGTEYIIQALKNIENKNDILILTCGETCSLGPLYKQFSVKELGLIDSDQLLYAYNACDIFLMPSLGESFGFMAIEAMSCHKPVIVFDNTSLPSVTFAPKCGVLVENKNSIELMNAIKMLIDNPAEREKRGELGRKLVEENYNIDTYNHKILEIYKSALNRKHTFLTNKSTKKIDENDSNYKRLVPILNKLTKKLCKYDYDIFKPLNISNKSLAKNIQIDFSNINVQETINQYLEKLYNIVHNTYTYIPLFPKRVSVRQFFWLLKNDRPQLKAIYSHSLKEKPFLYKIVQLLYKLVRKVKHILVRYKEIINYLIVGGLTTMVSLAIYYGSVFTFLNPDNPFELQTSNILSWIAGVTFAYFTNRKYVFESKNKNKLQEAAKFVSSRISTLLLDMLVMWLGVTVLGFNDKSVKIISQVLVIVGNYVLSKLFVFKKADK